MFEIPYTFIKDNYIQNPILKKFCKEKGIKIDSDIRVDLIKAFKDYASQNSENKKIALNWILKVIKEGSKEFCYRKVYNIPSKLNEESFLNSTMLKIFPDCLFKNVVDYQNVYQNKLINFEIFSIDGKVKKLSLVFSRLVLEGEERNTIGEATIYPIFVDLYFDKGFIVSRGKAKSTIYNWTESKYLTKETKINTKDESIRCVDTVLQCLGIESDSDSSVVKTKVNQMLYKLYEKFSFTPEDVKKEMQTVKQDSDDFVIHIFQELGLDYGNVDNAIQDIEIFLEKYISINGNKESIFKEDRDAYLVKIVSDDDQDMTKVDTMSSRSKPLQCTEAFFDSKRAIIKSRECNKINLCFRRNEKKYFGSDPFCVQFSTNKNYGYFKIAQYAEEGDIQYVLQTVFENY